MANPVESFTPSATGAVVDRSDLSASIQKELILQKTNGHGTINDASSVGHPVADGGSFKGDGTETARGHQGLASGGEIPKEIEIPPSSSIYGKSKQHSSDVLHKTKTLNGDETTKAHDSEELGQHVTGDTKGSVKMDSKEAWAKLAPEASGADYSKTDSYKDTFKKDANGTTEIIFTNGEEITISGSALRLGRADDGPPAPVEEYHVIGPAIPLGNDNSASGAFANPFIAQPGSDKKPH